MRTVYTLNKRVSLAVDDSEHDFIVILDGKEYARFCQITDDYAATHAKILALELVKTLEG
jgi:hypothetical protein